jgi:hypothetical protein
MDRKQFLGTLFVLPVGVFLVHCSSDSSTASNSGGSGGTGGANGGTGGASGGTGGTGGTGGADLHAPAAPATQSGGMDIYTSSDDGTPPHHHTFTLDDTAISSPPAAGVSGSTSTDSQHSHTVAITMAQLAMVGTGQTVQVISSSAGSHTHYFTFEKIA